MKKRLRQRKNAPHVATAPSPNVAASAPPRSWERAGWVVASVAVLALAASLAYRYAPTARGEPLAQTTPARTAAAPDPMKPGEPDDFLNEFNAPDPVSAKAGERALLTDAELEQRFEALATIYNQITALKARRQASAFETTQLLQGQFDEIAAALEKDLARAKLARPNSAVARWLTGELLMLVGGEPEDIQPYLDFAYKQGLRRPRLLASLARAQLGANRFADADRLAEAALAGAGQDQYVWETYARIAYSNQRFAESREQLARAFPTTAPDWVRVNRARALELQEHWEAELRLRAAEAKANDLPRVRFTIEHRRFGKDASGQPLTTVESTGREQVVLELFENEAPLTVANFIELVTRGSYDGTRFHLAIPVTMVVGGDPQTRGSDTAADGTGGPGYVIPDEFQKPGARRHFRGSLSMVNTEHTAGSQFFICLAPAPGADGHCTVFGRVLEGMDAIDRITRGKTTRSREVDLPGRLIPGDLLVRAEVLRKRNHEYRAVKE